MGPYMALVVPSSFYRIDAGLHALSFSPGFNVDLHKLTVFKIDTVIYRSKLFTGEFHYLVVESSQGCSIRNFKT